MSASRLALPRLGDNNNPHATEDRSSNHSKACSTTPSECRSASAACAAVKPIPFNCCTERPSPSAGISVKASSSKAAASVGASDTDNSSTLCPARTAAGRTGCAAADKAAACGVAEGARAASAPEAGAASATAAVFPGPASSISNICPKCSRAAAWVASQAKARSKLRTAVTRTSASPGKPSSTATAPLAAARISAAERHGERTASQAPLATTVVASTPPAPEAPRLLAMRPPPTVAGPPGHG
mmetsp:Transcript_162065/g.514909  ORF Transcript_162065/g.514909 Transcript_162065/m.514909 type:complete len:243 (+) Transcript_162065:136-864(+)